MTNVLDRSGDPSTQDAVAARPPLPQLARGLRALRPLASALDRPLRVSPWGADDLTCARLLAPAPIAPLIDDLAGRLGTRPPELEARPSKMTAFDLVATNCLRLTPDLWTMTGASASHEDEAARAVEGALQTEPQSYLRAATVRSFDGTLLRAYAGGRSDAPAVVLAMACGMPVELCEPWLRYLSREHYVMTWETRSLFGGETDFHEIGHGVDAQAEDLLSVVEHFGRRPTHAMGFCGGAVIALAAAWRRPEAISSLSLWHGDYAGFGGACPTTRHQDDVAALMAMAGKSRADASMLHKLFTRASVLDKLRADVAHHLLYPYATPESLFRYGVLNGAIMRSALELFVVAQPTLLVTSRADDTAHPAGSHRLAGLLANSCLHVEDEGDHLTLFDGQQRLMDLARAFIRNNRAWATL